MKTVKEFAGECGVSIKTIYRALDRLGQMSDGDKDSQGQGLSVKVKGVTYITGFGEPVIKDFVKPVQGQAETDKDSQSQMSKGGKPTENSSNSDIMFLREQLLSAQDELNKEREHSRKLADRLATITENQQILLGIEQRKTEPTLISENPTVETSKKRGILGFFSRK